MDVQEQAVKLVAHSSLEVASAVAWVLLVSSVELVGVVCSPCPALVPGVASVAAGACSLLLSR